MIDALAQFFLVTLGAVFLQNALFTQGLGAERTLIKQPPSQVLRLGATLTLVMVISSILSWLVNRLLLRFPLARSYMRSILFILCIAVTYLSLYWLSKKYASKLLFPVGRELIISASSCVVLGTLLLAAHENMTFFNTIGMGIGAGAGYTMALLVITEGRDRLALLNVPKIFRGLPITLLYLGLLSLAICGLAGHQLPI